MVLVLLLFLAGCATTAEQGEAGGQARAYTSDIDYERMDRITRAARREGTRVIWINPPEKSEDEEKGNGQGAN